MTSRYLTVFLVILVLLAAGLVLVGGFPSLIAGSRVGLVSGIVRDTPAPKLIVVPERATPEPAPTISPRKQSVLEQSGALLEALYQQANPSVVNIKVLSRLPTNRGGASGMSLNESAAQFLVVSEGSGFVYDQAGHIVTNFHVIEGATEIDVTFADETVFPGKLIGSDRASDLAVINVEAVADRLRPLPFADSETLRVGQQVVAIGSPFNLRGSMTLGIVSALGRLLPNTSEGLGASTYAIPDIIQTDAAINPGSSGGPLLNLSGEIVGVNTAIQSPVEGWSGVGFVIPINIVRKVVPRLIEQGHYDHPWIGISTITLNRVYNQGIGLPPELRGAIIVEVVEGGPASKAGLCACSAFVEVAGQQLPSGGDVVLTIDDEPVFKFDDILSYLASRTEVGQTVRLGILREGETIEVPIVVEAQPDITETS